MTYTAPRPATFTVFDHTTTDAQEGDYFKLPYQPVVKIIQRIDLGDIVTYLVQSKGNPIEQWDIMKPEAQQREQERYRVEAEENERIMSDIIHETAFNEFVESLNFDWLTEPIGSNPDTIFGMTGEMTGEQQAEILSPIATGYHDAEWTSDGCEF